MTTLDKNCVATIEFELNWKSGDGSHTDCRFAEKVNPWRDILPKTLVDGLMGRRVGDFVEQSFQPGEILPAFHPSKLFRVKPTQFGPHPRTGETLVPRQGRFYPKGILKDVPNVYRANMEPFRCTEVTDTGILVDFNHPLSTVALHLKASVRDIRSRGEGWGGTCTEWIEALTAGPGMQARWEKQPTDFFSDTPFARADEELDGVFYQQPRFVHHLDATALETVTSLYGRLLQDGDRVLDLMSSWVSHLPDRLSPGSVTGLGLSREELERNERLTSAVVHDLNQEPSLPFADASFDAVICTVSVEYLTKPLAVFREVGRILRPGGCFVTTFSNRWFPPKVVRIWEQLHEFERMGLVSEYFYRSEMFGDVNTYSMRGLPRPEDDKYSGELSVSDPVYGVWAYRR